MIPILILAGGASSRMGGVDKLLQPAPDVPLLRLVTTRAVATGHPVWVAHRPERPDRIQALDGLDVENVVVPEALEGMGGTMRAGIAALPDFDAVLMVLGDLPEISTADMTRVIAARAAHPNHLIWRGATRGGQAGHPVLFDGAIRAKFADLRGDTGGEALVRPLRDQTHLIPFDTDRARLDLDTPEDWQAWRSGASRQT